MPKIGSMPSNAPKTAHVIISYTALLSLAILRDDFARLDRQGLGRLVQSCQQPDGSFSTCLDSQEIDVRSSYCAFVLQHLLGAPLFDTDKAVAFILACERYDGSFAQSPGLEGNGGSTYCAVASLALAGRASQVTNQRTLDWLVHRQANPHPRLFLPAQDSDGSSEESADDQSVTEAALKSASMAGQQGRAHKDVDSCYSFWIGASIRIAAPDLLQPDPHRERAWLFACQHPIIGGLANQPGNPPDVYHTYLALAALSLSRLEGIQPLDPVINVTVRTLAYLQDSKKTLSSAA